MRATIFHLEDEDDVRPEVIEKPAFEPLEEYEGKKVEKIDIAKFPEVPGAVVQLCRIGAGGHLVMHAAPATAFVQILRGKGVLGLPNGREVRYEAPELFVFRPDTVHDWHGVEEDTLLAVCIAAC